MSQSIERRLKRGLFVFLAVSREYYEDLDRYEPTQKDYRQVVEPLLDSSWKTERGGVWWNCLPDDADTPGQGFKIHLCATSVNAAPILRIAAETCIARRVAFKFLVSGFILDFANSKNYPRVSAGKFVTIYPPDNEVCGEILEELHRATSEQDGPYILSDRPYRESSVVFYRYGGFIRYQRLNIFGEQRSMMKSEDGSLVPDERNPFYSLPEGVVDPFCEPMESHVGEVLLNGRYAIEEALRFSNSGGVYRAVDRQTGNTVVVKEARPFVNLTEDNPVDAVATLRKERDVLELMQETPYVPRLIDFFTEWKHSYLVEEYVEGIALSSYRALDDVGLLVQQEIDAQWLENFCRKLFQISSGLLAALEAFHERGIILGDFAPSNVIVDRETLNLTVIDYEGCFLPGDDQSSSRHSTITIGFVPKRRLAGGDPAFEDDYFSLGSMIYSFILPIQEFFVLNPEANRRFYEALERDYDLPSVLGEVIFSFQDGDLEQARQKLNILRNAEIDDWRPELRFPARVTQAELHQEVESIANRLLETIEVGRRDRLWPSDYRVFTTNSLNIAYGALGIARFLKEATGTIPKPVEDWILNRELSTEHYPGGLYVGLSGIAWALDNLGYYEKARQAIDLAYTSELLHDGFDLFFGSAGVGLASLHFWHRTGEQVFLDQALRAAKALEESAQGSDSKDGLHWINADDLHYYGYAHGGAGVALFFLELYLATGERGHLAMGQAALEHEIRRAAIQEEGYLVWKRAAFDELLSPYWRYGTAGACHVLLRYFQETGESRYRELTERGAKYVDSKYAVFPGFFVGLSGMGEFLVEMHSVLGEDTYLQNAHRLAESILLYRMKEGAGSSYPGEELLRKTSDLGTGAAGVGLFLLRAIEPRRRPICLELRSSKAE